MFQNNKPYVIDEVREGRFDYLELASDVAETKFFQFLFGQGLVDQLADHYPSPRQRKCVPLAMYVSSQLSLRLHGSHSFHSDPLLIRTGGLLDALGPEIAQRQGDPATGDLTVHCEGFNHRNRKPRATPCDQERERDLGFSRRVSHRPIGMLQLLLPPLGRGPLSETLGVENAQHLLQHSPFVLQLALGHIRPSTANK